MTTHKKAEEASNSITHLPIPFGDINNRRFVTAVLAGVLGGAGISAGANLLRQFRELREKRKNDTDDSTIVLTLPKAAESAYESMKGAKPGESKPTARGGTQLRDSGKFAGKIVKDEADAPSTKTAAGDPGPNTVGTIVANTLGLTAGGLLSYEVVSRLFDKMNERRLERKLEAAQQAYVSALNGASKRAEDLSRIFRPLDRVFLKESETKQADVMDILRYPTAFYLLSLLAGTGSAAYVTKKVMDREFPEDKLRSDINRPTRIVFRTEGTPSIAEGAKGEEKEASAETCAAITAMLPIYMDVVEGKPSRTLAEPYRKIAEASGTDAAGLMKMAAADMGAAYMAVLKDPKALWQILLGTNFGLNFSKLRAARILRDTSPDTYRRAVDAAIDSSWANGPNDGLIGRAYNGIGKALTKAYASLGGRDSLVEGALSSKSAAADDGDSRKRLIDHIDRNDTVLALGSHGGFRDILRKGVNDGSIRTMDDLYKVFAAAGHPEVQRADTELAPITRPEYEAYLKERSRNTAGTRWGGAAGSVLGALLAGIAAKRNGGRAGIAALAGAGTGLLAGSLIGRAFNKKDRGVYDSIVSTRAASGDRNKKSAEADDLLRASYIGSSVFKGTEPEKKKEEPEPTKSVISKAKKALRERRKVTVHAADPNAAAFVSRNQAIIRTLLARLNARGAI